MTVSVVVQGSAIRRPDAYTKLLCRFDPESLYMLDMTGKTLSTSGTTWSGTTKKFGAGAQYFNGTNNKFTITHADFNATGSDFCYEMFFKLEAINRWHALVASSNWAGSASGDFYFTVTNQNKFTIDVWPNSGSRVNYTSTATITDTASFHHIAFVGYAGNIYLYLDGTSILGPYAYSGTVGDGSLSIGADTWSWFYGYMDELKVSIDNARYTGNFTPPTRRK